MPANSCRKRWHERIGRKRRQRISDLGDRKPRQIESHAVNRCFPLPSRQWPPDVGQKLQCLNEMLAAASHAQRHAALKQRPLRCVVINCLQPADHAAIARMLHDDGDLAQFSRIPCGASSLSSISACSPGRTAIAAPAESGTIGCWAFNGNSIGSTHHIL